MLTRDTNTTEDVDAGASVEDVKPLNVETTPTEQSIQQRHDEVEKQTQSLMVEWICLLSVNFVAHFMRMSVVMLYCIDRFHASAFQVGLLVTIHMLIMGVANAYLCYVIDYFSFESLMIARFVLLFIATLGEYLAGSFELFAVIYAVASLAVVWFGVQTAYCVQVLPSRSAKVLTNVGIMCNQFGVLLGLSLGGCVGGFVSIRSVFLVSCVIALLSLLWILLILRGKEKVIRHIQATEISQMYRDFPHLFTDPNCRFPIVLTDLETSDDTTTLKSDHVSLPTAHTSRSPASVGVTTADPSEIRPILVNESDIKNKTNNMNDESTNSNSFSLCNLSAMPFWLLTIRHGINAAAISELIAWWNVYTHQQLNGSLAQSNGQFVVAIVSGILFSIVVLRLIKPQSMEFNVLLNFGSFFTAMGSVVTSFEFFWVFPHFKFDQFWFGLIFVQCICGITFPFSNTLQVAESPPQSAGKLFAVLTASRSIIPAVQHAIIGSLWSVGGSDHPWFFRWFGILHLSSGIAMIVYWAARTRVNAVDTKGKRKIIQNQTIMVPEKE